MKLYRHIASELEQFKSLVSNLESGKNPTLVVGLSQIHKAHFIYSTQDTLKKQTLIITHDELSARVLVEDINAMQGDTIAYLYPTRDFALRQVETASREYEQIRLGVLSRLLSGECRVAVASIEAVLQHTIPPSYLKERSFQIRLEGNYVLDELVQKLVRSGYENKPQVEGVCQFCVRGGILDVFPPNYAFPVRIEFWGDQVDTMAFFDIETQRRTERVDIVSITPANEVLFDSMDDLANKIEALIAKTKLQKAKEVFGKDLDHLRSRILLNSYDKYLCLAYDTPATIFDYLQDPICFVSEYSSMKERCKTYLWQYQEDIKLLLEEGEMSKPLCNLNQTLPYVMNRLDKIPTAYLDTFAHTNNDVKFASLLSINPIQTSSFGGELKLLCEDTAPLLEQGYAVVVLAGTSKAAMALAQDLQQLDMPAQYVTDSDQIAYNKITVVANTLSSGMEYPDIKVNIITTGRQADSKKRSERFKKGKQIRSLTDLEKGDLVVHVSHGIGVFEGIHKLEMQGIVKDYIKISYAGADTLYVPVTQLDLVSKYIGPKDDGKVKLNKLHSTEWQKTRSRVKKAVEDMADELILLYARRMQAKGYAFSEDTEWQKDFEQHFPYTETDDQLRCIEEIKADMERPVPMDRVLCGDVGFGKTEVAMRACFKCVMDNKQAAILCPTTILAWQHYQSFTKRFESFPINIEVLSRFRTPKQQKEILQKLKDGRIDIIIGTHRLVQKDIEFHDLGLAIVDEEQRFGVRHKERFKEMFTNVDMLNLSATPIPRTLNMAISGIRDMSTIEQAPQDRHPVQSYVLEHDMSILGDAIKKELRRGGQVYYIHNKIDSIELCASKIQAEVPEARIAVAHGRMEEKEITEIWRQLLEHEIDILVCTTIIETGVDVANCNTLIIENADHMGLSQLYQLRGRVGRSNRRAFAYFTFTRGKVLTEIANKRLSAIREFTKFGSGFRIAMRDLEIRGAGSILGAKQHGHMEAVGYDMYLRLLSEAIAEKKGEQKQVQTHECLIDLRLDAHIPEEYIDDTSQRIDIYRKIATIKTKEDSLDVIDELIDRFGEPPKAALSLIDVALLRNTLATYGFEEINEKPQGLLLYPNKLDMDIAQKLIEGIKGRVMVNAGNRPYIVVKPIRGQKVDAVAILRECVDALG
ncbi:transcription-repair coupling factor [Paludicola sp. MB14-C6]|uniref:transcription-repair coupling factor n=1 Tax=Paludihabitans sp. MB14-C6 TaxID=3070656 RepID=UPI0027DC93E7|nr:transcription-repair coupling factor [Paludicola sp. MB14-C6]WMJ22067.1 transcription-repair coupling factor [Paludicola sp. MB14-C6]